MAEVMEQSGRHARIMHKLEIQGVVSVCELSSELQTSEVTIRKDLQALEQAGKLSRVRGGAVLRRSSGPQHDQVYAAQTKNIELKRAVARTAAQFIQSGDSLIVTAGATPHLTVRCASQCTNLKIVTDSLITAEDLCHRPDYQVIILGGEIYTKESFIHGRDAVRQAGRYMADKAIVTMDGVDPAAGLTTLRVEGADTLKSILARARMRIVVADITKIGTESFCHIGAITIADILVTNETEDPEKKEILRQIADAGVRIYYADKN